MNHELANAPLGHETRYPTRYDPSLLFPIKRQTVIPPSTPYIGWDYWRGYELSWLQSNGLPCVALIKIMVPFHSPYITESKSLKLYLNSFNQEKFESVTEIAHCIKKDISHAAGTQVEIEVLSASSFHLEKIEEPDGLAVEINPIRKMLEINIDQSDRIFHIYSPDASLLMCHKGLAVKTEAVFSRLLKSNCPVTNQPDWASVHIGYRGHPIDHDSLLAYIVSFRQHQGFHEQCVETIFADLMQRCEPEMLSVYARYTRRGGLDINPWRATPGCPPPSLNRSAQQ